MLPPLPRCSSWAYSSLISPSRVSLPRKGHRVGPHIVLFEACSAFTRVAACTLARSPIRDPLSEGFRHFVSSMPAPVASGWSESPGGACTHWKAPPCHGAHPKPTSREDRVSVPARPTATWGTAMRRQRAKSVIQLAPTGREKPLHSLQEKVRRKRLRQIGLTAAVELDDPVGVSANAGPAVIADAEASNTADPNVLST